MNVVTFNFTITSVNEDPNKSATVKTGTHRVCVPKNFCTTQELLKDVLKMYIFNMYIFETSTLTLPDGSNSVTIEIQVVKSQQY